MRATLRSTGFNGPRPDEGCSTRTPTFGGIHMSHLSSVLRLARPVLAIATLAACACARSNRADEATLADGAALRGDRCNDSELMVVENHTGYPVRVIAGEGHVNAMPGSSEEITIVQSGAVDTIQWVRKDLHKVSFDVQQPHFADGMRVPYRGLSVRCVPRG